MAAKNYQRTSGALLFTFYAPATPNNCRLMPTVFSLAQALYRNHPSSRGHSHSANTAALFRAFHLRSVQNVILLHFSLQSVCQTVPNRYTYKPALLALLISLLLIAGNAAALHVHQDGLAHYSDCDSCLQIQAQTGTVSSQPCQLHITSYRALPVSDDRTAIPATTLAFSARAPPFHALSR